MARVNTHAGLAGLVAALSMAATPVAAAELPSPKSSSDVPSMGVFDKDGANAERHRHWRRDRVDAGDVLAGVLIIGGIAAVASAASKSSRDKREADYRYRGYPTRPYPERPYDYRERRGDSRYDGGRGIDNAVELCVNEIERDVRVDTVDSVDRTGEGWRVTGALYNGDRFTCNIGADGRVEGVDFGGLAAREDKQWDDDRYEAAWRNREAEPRTPAASSQQVPAYPGGPIDGDLDESDEGGADDRYTMAGAN